MLWKQVKILSRIFNRQCAHSTKPCMHTHVNGANFKETILSFLSKLFRRWFYNFFLALFFDFTKKKELEMCLHWYTTLYTLVNLVSWHINIFVLQWCRYDRSQCSNAEEVHCWPLLKAEPQRSKKTETVKTEIWGVSEILLNRNLIEKELYCYSQYLVIPFSEKTAI